MTGFKSKREMAQERTSMTKEALKMALEALEMADELCRGHGVDFKKYGLEFDRDIQVKYKNAITAIREALAQPPLPVQPAQAPTHGPILNKLLAYVCNVPDDGVYAGTLYQERNSLIAEAREALAQPVQEPDLAAAYMSGLHDGKKKRPWVGLTDDDILQIRENVQIVEGRGVLVSMTIAIEQALKEKNT